ncbi:hypothetical protein P171DRAFT_264590 [Karstenula rhodostoma CBS 690.94]|uniref:Uncharacterized protein n=1 Tax=Karstenula rhodostoma CBS 690.94 TaxID=1392251 RepID=A0A9P4UDG7_9PLEO|nr:hypothetical protein P171DRAFT_264590 [Karstenula rhodostoma CBS 690.94]
MIHFSSQERHPTPHHISSRSDTARIPSLAFPNPSYPDPPSSSPNLPSPTQLRPFSLQTPSRDAIPTTPTSKTPPPLPSAVPTYHYSICKSLTCSLLFTTANSL